MALRWYSIVIDSHDIAAQARWWGDLLGWELAYESAEEAWIAPRRAAADREAGTPWEDQGPAMCFVPVPEAKTVKNRVHIDLAPWVDDDHEATVAAAVAKGATRIDVGQDPARATWEVLADPEGNEFCILSSRRE